MDLASIGCIPAIAYSPRFAALHCGLFRSVGFKNGGSAFIGGICPA